MDTSNLPPTPGLQPGAVWTEVPWHKPPASEPIGISFIIRTMKEYYDDVNKQRSSVKALCSRGENPDMALVIIKEGGVEAILRAMDVHKSDPETLKMGSWVLARIACVERNPTALPAGTGRAVLSTGAQSQKSRTFQRMFLLLYSIKQPIHTVSKET